jgi:hypothetical protein
MHVPPPQAFVKVLTEMFVGPVRVLLAGVFQSTWNFHRPNVLAVVVLGMFRK